MPSFRLLVVVGLVFAWLWTLLPDIVGVDRCGSVDRSIILIDSAGPYLFEL